MTGQREIEHPFKVLEISITDDPQTIETGFEAVKKKYKRYENSPDSRKRDKYKLPFDAYAALNNPAKIKIIVDAYKQKLHKDIEIFISGKKVIEKTAFEKLVDSEVERWGFEPGLARNEIEKALQKKGIEIVEEIVEEPRLVFNAAIESDHDSIRISWHLPASDRDEVLVIRRDDRSPGHAGDGKEIFRGLAEHYRDNDISPGKCYYYAIFTQFKGRISKHPVRLHEYTVSPVSNAGAESHTNEIITRWDRPKLAERTVIIRRAVKPPVITFSGNALQISEGEKIYEGKEECYTDTGLAVETDYYYSLIAVYPDNRYSPGVDLQVKTLSPPVVPPKHHTPPKKSRGLEPAYPAAPAAPSHGGRSIRMIWVTDGESHAASRRFIDERNTLRNNNLEHVAEFSDGLDDYYTFETVKDSEEIRGHISIHYYEVQPKSSLTGIRVKNRAEGNAFACIIENFWKKGTDFTPKEWNWTFVEAGDPMPLNMEKAEVALRQIVFTKYTDKGDVRANHEELREILENLKLNVRPKGCHELEENGAAVDIPDDAVYFKDVKTAPDIRVMDFYSQVYINPAKIRVKRKSQLALKISLKSADEEKVKIGRETGESTVILTLDYGDLHIAVDFGTTATTCVFGRPEAAELKTHRAVLEMDEAQNPQHMLNSIVFNDRISDLTRRRIIRYENLNIHVKNVSAYKPSTAAPSR